VIQRRSALDIHPDAIINLRARFRAEPGLAPTFAVRDRFMARRVGNAVRNPSG
jgi:hypothetical protein